MPCQWGSMPYFVFWMLDMVGYGWLSKLNIKTQENRKTDEAKNCTYIIHNNFINNKYSNVMLLARKVKIFIGYKDCIWILYRLYRVIYDGWNVNMREALLVFSIHYILIWIFIKYSIHMNVSSRWFNRISKSGSCVIACNWVAVLARDASFCKVWRSFMGWRIDFGVSGD